MKRKLLKPVVALVCLFIAFPAQTSEFDWWKAASAGIQAYQAMTLSDEEVVEYVKQSVKYMDSRNGVLPDNNAYSVRLKRITSGITKVDGVPLNFKVYKNSDVNAFACADGSVRVYSALMDIMTDDEILGIIGHEIGHVGLHHSRKAIKQELLTGALRDALASSNGKIGMLADSQLGAIGEVLISSKYSRKQETEADDYGYNFLKSNGKNPWSLILALEKLQSLEKKSNVRSSYLTNMFSSHPDTQKRITHLKERCQKDKIKRPA